MSSYNIRRATLADVAAMVALQNAVIRTGAFSAYQHEVTEDWFADAFLTGPAAICCHLAEGVGLVAFQTLERHPLLPSGWADIGTFAAPEARRSGAGRGLFATTVAVARGAGVSTINATIRADNATALAYYAAMGFADYAHDPDWRLQDGRVRGRVSKRLDLL